MSLINPTVPGDILRAYTTGLGDFVNTNSPLWPLLLTKYSAVEAYTLKLCRFCEITDIQSIATLHGDLIQSSGWRFLATDGDLYGGCHVGSILPGHPPKLTGFSDSVQVLTAIERLNEVSESTIPLAGDYEKRILRIPWLHMETVWLMSLSPGGVDVMVPYIGFVESSSKDVLTTLEPISMPDFLVAIFPRVQAVCAQSYENDASIQARRARMARMQAGARESAIAALKSHADNLEAKARDLKAASQRVRDGAKTPPGVNVATQ